MVRARAYGLTPEVKDKGTVPEILEFIMSAYKKEILKILFKHIPRDNCVVFIFGSFTKSKVYPSSDIDIGIICDTALGNSALVKIKEDLADIRTLRDIDLVDFSSITDKNFLKIALKEVTIWHQTKKSKAFLTNLRKQING